MAVQYVVDVYSFYSGF